MNAKNDKPDWGQTTTMVNKHRWQQSCTVVYHMKKHSKQKVAGLQLCSQPKQLEEGVALATAAG